MSDEEDLAPTAPGPKLRFDKRRTSIWQLLYIFVGHGIGSFIISGGIEFAIAYGMYHSPDHPVRLFRLPNTLAGDTAVTIFVQLVVTFWIETILVYIDLKNRIIRGLHIFRPPQNRWVRLYFDLDPEPVVVSDERTRGGRLWQAVCENFFFLLSGAVRALLLSIPVFFIFWPSAVGIATSFGEHRGGDYYYNHFPAPQLYKLVFGGTLGLVITPIFCSIRLQRHAWLHDVY